MSNVKVIHKPSNIFDTIIEFLMLSMLAFMPLALGVVDAWSEQICMALTAAMAVLLSLKFVMYKDLHPTWTWAYIPLGLFWTLAILQLLPLPGSVVNFISPNTVTLKADLLNTFPN
ncbi:MAG: hypothetical protein GY869_04525, partial [Planctomycetes bacterium]|nr:hypothetical protein [Planctomycetota bacterium]